jgi:hypothetical protein
MRNTGNWSSATGSMPMSAGGNAIVDRASGTGLLKGAAADTAPSVQVLAFVYWRMTWQGCSNPYLLRRGHRLPLYGVAEWQAAGPAPDEDDLDTELSAFSAALDKSWSEWLDCIDLLGVTTLERRA